MEKIYTIPINEAFDATSADPTLGCPLCLLRRKEEEREIDLILGASMMEPDIRIETNRRGFCGRHFRMMFARRNRLGLALILESHLDAVKENLEEPSLLRKTGAAASGPLRALGQLEEDCYLCARIDRTLARMTETLTWLWESDPSFQKKLAAQTCFCLPHYRSVLSCAKKQLPKKQFAAMYDVMYGIETAHLSKLREDVSWFCKKFDYRYEEEPWYDAKDAVERTIRSLCGEEEKEGKTI